MRDGPSTPRSRCDVPEKQLHLFSFHLEVHLMISMARLQLVEGETRHLNGVSGGELK